MPVAIRTRALTKSYGTKRGIEDVDLEVRTGEVFGFLGPNGAGKSTTIRALMGLLRPTRGSAEVLGLDPFRSAAELHRRIGYLPGEMGMAERLAGRDHLAFLARLREPRGAPHIEALANRLDLDLSKPIRKMSRGTKQKVGVVQAFMSDPELLILDEPTTGLDPLMQQEFQRLVREAKARGRTVFLSSHVMSEVETLCDRVAVIREGRIVAVEDVQALKDRALRHVRVRFSSAVRTGDVERLPGAIGPRLDGTLLTFSLRGSAGDLIRALSALPVEDLHLREATLDEVFQTYYVKEGPK